MELGLVIKELPALSSAKDNSKKSQGEYIIADNFFRFWFAYAYPYLTALSMGQVENVWTNLIAKNIHHLSSRAFENICSYYLWKQSAKGNTPFTIIESKRWWGKITRKDENGKLITTSEEIDILATDATKTNYIFGECKFKNELFDLQELTSLQSKLTVKGSAYYYLFSLSGFTEAVKKQASISDNIKLISLNSLFE